MPRSFYIVLIGAIGFAVGAVAIAAIDHTRTGDVYTRADVDAIVKPLVAAVTDLTTAAQGQNSAIVNLVTADQELLRMIQDEHATTIEHHKAITNLIMCAENHNSSVISLNTSATALNEAVGNCIAEIRKLKEGE